MEADLDQTIGPIVVGAAVGPVSAALVQGPSRRRVPGTPLLTAVLCLATLVTGCGSHGTAAPSQTSDTRLTITVAPGFIANAHVTRYRLTCAPPAGTVPDASLACRALQADAGLLAAMPCPLTPDTGSELVRGTANGARVDLRLSGSSACAHRWQRLSTALGIGG